MKGHCIVFWPRTFGEITRVHKLGQNVSQGHSDGNHLASFAGILSNFAKPQTPRDFEVLTQDKILKAPHISHFSLQAFPTSCPSSGTSTLTPLARSFVVCVRSSRRRPPTPTSWPSSPSPWSATWPSVGPSTSFLSPTSEEPPSSPLSVGPLPCLPASPTSSSPSRLHTKDKVFTFNSGSTSSPSPIPTDPQHQSLPFVPCWTYQRYSCWFLFISYILCFSGTQSMRSPSLSSSWSLSSSSPSSMSPWWLS